LKENILEEMDEVVSIDDGIDEFDEKFKQSNPGI